MKTIHANTVGKVLCAFISLFIITTMSSCSFVPAGGGYGHVGPPPGYMGQPQRGPMMSGRPGNPGSRGGPSVNDITYNRKFNGTWTIVNVDSHGNKKTRVVGIDDKAGMSEAEGYWKRDGHQLPRLSQEAIPQSEAPPAVRKKAEEELLSRGYRQ